MKLNIRKETAMKGLLLLALAGNVSFFKPALQSIDLSSEATGSKAPHLQLDTPVDDAVSKNPNAVSASDDGVRPDKPATVVTDEKPVVRESQDICGKSFFVTYREDQLKNGPRTHIYVQSHTVGTIEGFPANGMAFDMNGDFAMNIEDAEMKTKVQAETAKLVRSKLGASCSENVATRPERDGETRRPRHQRDDDDSTRTQNDCRLAGSSPDDKYEFLDCKIDGISEMRTGSSSTAQRAAVRQIETLVKNDIRVGLKNMLLSTNPETSEDEKQNAQDLLRNLKTALIAFAGDNQLTGDSEQRIISLQTQMENLVTGSETFQKSTDQLADYKSQRDDYKKDLDEAQNALKANQNDQMARMQLQIAQQNMQQLQQQAAQLAQQMQSNDIAPLQQMVINKQLDRQDFNQFTQPYKMLTSDLGVNTNLLGGPNGNSLQQQALGLGNQSLFGPSLTWNNGQQFTGQQFGGQQQGLFNQNIGLQNNPMLLQQNQFNQPSLLGQQNQFQMMNPTLMAPQQQQMFSPFNSQVGFQNNFRPGAYNGQMLYRPF